MPHWRGEWGLRRAPSSCALYLQLRRVDRSAGRIIKSKVDRSANIEGSAEAQITTSENPNPGIGMKDGSDLPGLFESLFRWAGNSVIATTHFLAILVVVPFSRQKAFDVFEAWSRTVSKWFHVEVRVTDEHDGNWGPPPYVFINLNQNSLSEVPVYYQVLPHCRAIINIEFAAIPFIGWAFTLLGSIVIVRQWKRQAKRGVERALRLLKNGESIGISIEGRRSPDGSISLYKKGPAVLAIGAGATFVPFVFHGARSVYPPGTWRIRPGTIELEICEPIETRGLSYEDRDGVVEKLRLIAQDKIEVQ
jgi:1-acyl-sn-glycerol-3-phosphate acyltransferase